MTDWEIDRLIEQNTRRVRNWVLESLDTRSGTTDAEVLERERLTMKPPDKTASEITAKYQPTIAEVLAAKDAIIKDLTERLSIYEDVPNVSGTEA